MRARRERRAQDPEKQSHPPQPGPWKGKAVDHGVLSGSNGETCRSSPPNPASDQHQEPLTRDLECEKDLYPERGYVVHADNTLPGQPESSRARERLNAKAHGIGVALGGHDEEKKGGEGTSDKSSGSSCLAAVVEDKEGERRTVGNAS
jgi:hypothetical protein